ncbi:hypothetical protein AVEN_253398-1 [Araneus ventricosus]|uniref:PDZ domain-containing protein n=1 Tax=Araneus ventricosus TaxID=182803 RepID=A0A4Y2L7I5_ARAVE|nr:hypothetical protein AVEN_253398-1 [Araneus ventricosus]
MRRGRKVKSQGFVGWLTATSNHDLSSLSHLIIGRGSKPKGFLCRHPGRSNSVRSFQLPRVMFNKTNCGPYQTRVHGGHFRVQSDSRSVSIIPRLDNNNSATKKTRKKERKRKKEGERQNGTANISKTNSSCGLLFIHIVFRFPLYIVLSLQPREADRKKSPSDLLRSLLLCKQLKIHLRERIAQEKKRSFYRSGGSMAYQQVSLELVRDGQCTPWGFRMTGGADIGTPLVIQKVSGS